MREWLESISVSSVVPERGQPITKTGRSLVIARQGSGGGRGG